MIRIQLDGNARQSDALDLTEVTGKKNIDSATAREVAPTIAGLRERIESLRLGELERQRGRLEGLDPKQREVVEAVTRGVMAKLLHDPTVRLKDAAGTARGERLSDALRELFDI